ncbi:hypothetical protein Bca4012_009839 [Brassica carinata]|uniref:RPW8 domain-containing protein n=1 Tax=Brassica carinata TaxID=52824 RepID=A0A8X7V1D4_BRACI|nr:hypothetical protein Bca52824_035061 [Brassica carinata]
MPIAEVVSLIPVTELMKMVISKAKKVKDFKPLFKELASTMQRLVPIIQEMDILQERLDPGNKELNFLTKTLRRAENMVRKCSRVREYDSLKKISYAEIIKGINDDFLKFCQLDLPLIQHRNMLRSLSLKVEYSPPRLEHNSNISTRDEGKGKQVQDQEDEQLAAALQESLNMQELDHSARQKTILRRRQPQQQVILESCKDKGKGKQLQEDEQVAEAIQESLNMEELSLSRAIQESIYLRQREDQVAKRRARELEKDEQIANALLYDEREKINNGSSSSTRARLDKDDLQRILWESFKNKGKGKQFY